MQLASNPQLQALRASMCTDKVRKHWRHMDINDRIKLSLVAVNTADIILARPEYERTIGHADDRGWQKNISHEQMWDCLRNFTQLIEFNYNIPGDDRRLVVKDDNGTTLVMSISRSQVITAYRNDKGDNHSTLREYEYTPGMDIWRYMCFSSNTRSSIGEKIAHYMSNPPEGWEARVKAIVETSNARLLD